MFILVIIVGESLEQPSEIPSHKFSADSLRGEFSSSRNGSKAPMPTRLCMLVYVGLQSDDAVSPMKV